MEVIKEIFLNFVKTFGTDIVWIFVLVVFGRIVLQKIVDRMIKMADDGDPDNKSNKEKRANTLGGVVIAIGKVVIYVIALLMTLDIFGVDIRPILAGVGIIGVAVGFGAKSLVKDFISGLFILIENQYSVGDKIKVGSSEGKVIRITMRSTILRDDEGKTMHLSNGYIAGKEIANFSQK